ncbi:Hsp20/alpha crystallin family protein [Candidatus Bipolaricaulota bacterium]|nr:Hsp20/alpha crystallin family protein [Candidatus Bipolaricaulota bacterium]
MVVMAMLPTVWREPFRLAARMSRLFDELFQDLGELEVWPSFGRSDVYVKDKTLVIETELPGARKEDVQVRVEDDRLVISGEVRRSEEVREENYIRMGRTYGAFRRAFPLPEEVEDKRKIKAKFENGVLRVEIPLRRAPEAEGAFEVKVE